MHNTEIKSVLGESIFLPALKYSDIQLSPEGMKASEGGFWSLSTVHRIETNDSTSKDLHT